MLRAARSLQKALRVRVREIRCVQRTQEVRGARGVQDTPGVQERGACWRCQPGPSRRRRTSRTASPRPAPARPAALPELHAGRQCPNPLAQPARSPPRSARRPRPAPGTAPRRAPGWLEAAGNECRREGRAGLGVPPPPPPTVTRTGKHLRSGFGLGWIRTGRGTS